MKLVPFLSCGVVSSVLLFGGSVHAATLETWKFDAQHHQLEIVTDGDVQPTAQLVADPTRLVIDLPGIVLGQPTMYETFPGTIQAIRIGQFDSNTTRLVVELAPGYTLDPQQIKFRGISARQWVVTLPAPIATAVAPASRPDATAASVPPIAPATAAIASPPSTAFKVQAATAPTPIATIEAIELDAAGNQLVIRANQPIRYGGRWERSQGVYLIEIPMAQLGKQVRSPQLSSSSPLRQVRLNQEHGKVLIAVRPASQVNVGQINQISQHILTLPWQRSPQPLAKPAASFAPVLSRAPSSQPLPTQSAWPPTRYAQTPTMPPANGRIVVIIDPGHGGPDPGAVGISGLQEKAIVLDIGIQVANLLQQYGVYALLTRADDRDLDLEPRVQMAEQAQAAAFVSIHANAISLSRPDISGLETYYYQSGADLAQIIHQNVLSATGIQDRGVRTARFYVLRKTSMPSVLVEVGFVTGQDDAQRLSNSSYRTQMATAIARGILQYLQRTATR